LFASSEVTFALTSGGHNVGIVNPPGVPKRHYRIGTLHAGAPFVDPDSWLASAEQRDGSWWTAYVDWLDARGGAKVPPPPPSEGLAAAPGAYVFET
jgi:polyhydroxyalkanoate synthase subunit PhaC